VGILSVYPHREHALIISIIIQTLSAVKIPLLAMGSSISAISCVINEEKVPDAIRVLSKEFGLS
jgi:aspartokinase